MESQFVINPDQAILYMAYALIAYGSYVIGSSIRIMCKYHPEDVALEILDAKTLDELDALDARLNQIMHAMKHIIAPMYYELVKSNQRLAAVRRTSMMFDIMDHEKNHQ